MTAVETRMLETLRRRGPLTDRAATGIGMESLDKRKALERLLAMGMVTFTKRGRARWMWRVEPVHEIPESFAIAVLTAFALRRGGPLSFTLEDAQATAQILKMLTGTAAEVRHARRVLEEAQAVCAAVVSAHRRPS